MPRFLVETTATVRRHYEVTAADEKAAIAATSDMTPTFEEDDNEETQAVSPIKD